MMKRILHFLVVFDKSAFARIPFLCNKNIGCKLSLNLCWMLTRAVFFCIHVLYSTYSAIIITKYSLLV